MKEYMFLIRNEGDPKKSLSPELHTEFLQKCESYIDKLKSEGKLIAAQPVERQGKIISKSEEGWSEVPFNAARRIWVGYYHILATNLDEAFEIAKANPEFEYIKSASIEIRPLKMKERETA